MSKREETLEMQVAQGSSRSGGSELANDGAGGFGIRTRTGDNSVTREKGNVN